MVTLRFLGCELRKGCTIIGAVWLVFSALVIVGGPLTLRMFEQIAEEEYRSFEGTVSPEAMQYAFIAITVYRTCTLGVTIIAVADAMFSIMLIIGSKKEKRSLVLPWMMEQLALMPIWVLIMLAFDIMCFSTFHVLIGSIVASVVAVRIAVTMYALLVVYGLCEFLRRHEPPANPISAL